MERKEAIKIVRNIYQTDAEKEALETLIPELRESEDERIRKELIGMVKFHCADEHLDRYLNWLEKQKENPKSAISIPSDCASDAKCEDRWHKVADFLPDNPREVLCKDEAGNYFIGRYYTSEGWEISNYDDEDKPHHLNPPVSKWIDFPSEKQKEQKPNYCHFGGDPNVERCRYCSATCSARLTEEQKPAEPSDEELQRHQDELYDFKVFAARQAKEHHISFVHDFEWNNFCAELLSYFNEKQKPAERFEEARKKYQVEWSEEDEKMRVNILNALTPQLVYSVGKGTYTGTSTYKYDDEIKWLKSLRPSWKPSEHQMNILKAVKEYVGRGSGYWGEGLGSLIEDLEKLI